MELSYLEEDVDQDRYLKALTKTMNCLADEINAIPHDEFYLEYLGLKKAIEDFEDIAQERNNFWDYELDITKLHAGAYMLFEEFKNRHLYTPFKPRMKMSMN